jgi:pyruvate/2-oxoglutarate/acetoin dehydrogenase E1 component
MNAACVLEVPMLMSVWDDGYGISVPKKYQTVKESISTALAGFQREEATNGLVIYRIRGWDYPQLIATYEEAAKRCREDHVPVLVHVEEVTQPQGHSTSGSHERYKSEERLAWAQEFDCLRQMERFLMAEGAATEEELAAIRKESKKGVRSEQKEAWTSFRKALDADRDSAVAVLEEVDKERADALAARADAGRADMAHAVRMALASTAGEDSEERRALGAWLDNFDRDNEQRYSATLYSDQSDSALRVHPVAASYDGDAEWVDGRLVLQRNFEEMFRRDPRVLTFGEDTGGIGGVNQVMEGMQEKFGDVRVSDTGIRECTILGQGIGMALRGLRPIAEIQYLDYLYYGLQLMRDDLATVRYRTAGGQKAPLIIRTRGHRLEGIWHSGSPMGAIVHSVRGIHVCVPRDMTQAAGMYNTLLEAEEPALVVECLNGYRKKERCPSNLGDFRVALGDVETLREGSDLTLLSYGSTLHLCEEACVRLSDLGVEVELLDAQTLLPFDLEGKVAKSVAKTNRLLVVDEDVPGGASAYLLDDVLNRQRAWNHLDGQAKTLTAKPHLPAYGSDGDYFSKPSVDDIVESAYNMLREVDSTSYPSLR